MKTKEEKINMKVPELFQVKLQCIMTEVCKDNNLCFKTVVLKTSHAHWASNEAFLKCETDAANIAILWN